MLVVTGMSCRHCVRQVTACLRDIPGVETVEADRVTCQVRLQGRFALPDVLSALARGGHQARVLGDSTAGSAHESARTSPRSRSLAEEES